MLTKATLKKKNFGFETVFEILLQFSVCVCVCVCVCLCELYSPLRFGKWSASKKA